MSFPLGRWVDSQYRPLTYFRAINTNIPIRGAARRQRYLECIKNGDAEAAEIMIEQSPKTDEERQAIGRIHLHLMGGEYLPEPTKGEVEVARVTINSTTWDVTSVYATQTSRGTLLRVVDEYEGQTITGCDTLLVRKPLTLLKFMHFFFSGWNLLQCLDYNYRDRGFPEDEIHEFVMDATSDFYAEFEPAVHMYINWWLNRVERLGADQALRLS
jgi:hypothetical protein